MQMKGNALILEWCTKVKAKIHDFHTSWVWRGEEDQNKFVKEKKSELSWPDSLHNTMKDGEPWAEAFDGFIQRDGGLFSMEALKPVRDFLVESKSPFDWSWDLFGKDAPHFQLKRKFWLPR
jgi:hypothetical protein